MRWASERRRQFRSGIAFRRVQLRLDQKDTVGEVGTAEVGASEVGPNEVGHSQVGASEISSNEVCPPQAGASEIRAFEVSPDEVGSSAVLLVPNFGSHEFARAQQQGIDVSAVCFHVQFRQSLGGVVSETFGILQREAELTVERLGRLQRQRFAQIPEQLLEIPHDREHLEHLLRGVLGPPPVLPAESDLGDFLPRAEAVVNGATPETLLPEACVNAATEVRLQIGTSLPGGFVDREVCRGCEGRRDTAKPEAAFAVSSKAEAISFRCGL
jgi:hypothetical protein